MTNVCEGRSISCGQPRQPAQYPSTTSIVYVVRDAIEVSRQIKYKHIAEAIGPNREVVGDGDHSVCVVPNPQLNYKCKLFLSPTWDLSNV